MRFLKFRLKLSRILTRYESQISTVGSNVKFINKRTLDRWNLVFEVPGLLVIERSIRRIHILVLGTEY